MGGVIGFLVIGAIVYLVYKVQQKPEDNESNVRPNKPTFLGKEKIGLWNNISNENTFPASDQIRKQINLNLMVEIHGMSEVDLKKQIISSFKSKRNKQSMLDELIQKSLDSSERDNLHPSDTVPGIMTDWIFEYIQLQNK